MTHVKHWPSEVDTYRRRAIKHAQRILRLGDKLLHQVEAGKPPATPADLLQMRRWAKAVQTEMIRARQEPGLWPRVAENARLDTIVACDQILRLVNEAESVFKQGEALALMITQIQVHAQDVELMLSRVA